MNQQLDQEYARFFSCIEYKNNLPENWTEKDFSNFQALDSDLKKAVNILNNKKIDDDIGVWISGKTGCGKTHLLFSTFKKLAWEYYWSNNRQINGQIKYYNYSDLCALIRENPTDFSLLKKIRNPKILFIDDIGTSKTTDFVQSIIYSIFNYRCENGLATYVTTNLNFLEISKEFNERMASRIKESSIWLELKNTGDYRNNKFKENMKEVLG